jgi:hypothetical protein
MSHKKRSNRLFIDLFFALAITLQKKPKPKLSLIEQKKKSLAINQKIFKFSSG